VLERRVTAPPGDERGLVEEQHERRVGKALLDEILGRDRPRPRRFTTAPEGLRHGQTAAEEREAQRQRSRDLHLDARRLPTARRRVEKREEAAVRVGVEGCDRRLVRDPVDGDRAVALDRDLRERTRPLRDDAFERRAHRELRGGWESRVRLEHEVRRRPRIGVRKASDRSGDRRNERRCIEGGGHEARSIWSVPEAPGGRSRR